MTIFGRPCLVEDVFVHGRVVGTKLSLRSLSTETIQSFCDNPQVLLFLMLISISFLLAKHLQQPLSRAYILRNEDILLNNTHVTRNKSIFCRTGRYVHAKHHEPVRRLLHVSVNCPGVWIAV